MTISDAGDRAKESNPRWDGESIPVLRQALWECYCAAGGDPDGDQKCPPPGVLTPDVHVLALDAVRELRQDCDHEQIGWMG
jgi:hypothetical protein